MPSYYYNSFASRYVMWRWKICELCVVVLVGHTQICTYVVVRILCAQDDVHHWEKTGTTFIP